MDSKNGSFSWSRPEQSSWFLWRSLNQEFQTPFGACRTRALNGPILPFMLRHQFLLTNNWSIEEEFILISHSPRTEFRRLRPKFQFECLCFFPFWRTFIGNWSRVRQSRRSRWNMLPWVAFCVWSGIDQAARHPPVSGCVRGLTPTSCATRTWRRSPGWGSTGWREERRERSELDAGRRHQRHRMRMRVRDGYEWCGHNFISSHGVPSVCSRESVLWHAPGSVFCVHLRRVQWFASDWTRKRNYCWKKSGWRSEVADLIANVLLKYPTQLSLSEFVLQELLHRLHLVWPLIILPAAVAILSKSSTTRVSSTRMLKTTEKKKMRLGLRVLLWSTAPNFRLAIPGTHEF